MIRPMNFVKVILRIVSRLAWLWRLRPWKCSGGDGGGGGDDDDDHNDNVQIFCVLYKSKISFAAVFSYPYPEPDTCSPHQSVLLV